MMAERDSDPERDHLQGPEWGVTVCFTHYNRANKLRHALEQLWQVSDIPLTVRVHENGSTQDVDAELEKLVDEGLIDELIQTKENLGIAGSRHLLLDPDDISDDYVLVLDDDMYVSDGWDRAILSVFDSEPDVGIVGAPFMIPGSGGIRDGGKEFTWSNGYPILDSHRSVLTRKDVDYSAIADPDASYIFVDDVPMGSSVLRREILSEVSLPDRQTFEDIAFSLDVANAGWDIVMSCETIFYHDKRIKDETSRNQTDWNAKLAGYNDFCGNRNLRFDLREHLLHKAIFRIPNPVLWIISDVKNGHVL